MTDMTANGLSPVAPAYRPGEHPDLPPPIRVTGPVAWLRRNFFSSIGNTILTILALLLLYLAIPGFIKWAFIDANFGGGLAITKTFDLKVVENTGGVIQAPATEGSAEGIDVVLDNSFVQA